MKTARESVETENRRASAERPRSIAQGLAGFFNNEPADRCIADGFGKKTHAGAAKEKHDAAVSRHSGGYPAHLAKVRRGSQKRPRRVKSSRAVVFVWQRAFLYLYLFQSATAATETTTLFLFSSLAGQRTARAPRVDHKGPRQPRETEHTKKNPTLPERARVPCRAVRVRHRRESGP